MARQYYYKTSVGTVWIRPQPDTDRFHLGIGDGPLGSYHSPEAAADDVYTQHTGWRPLDRLPKSELPRDITEWQVGVPE